MKPIVAIALLGLVVWDNAASAQSIYPDRPRNVSITGMLLPVEEQVREGLVTIKIFVQGQPRLLRVGEVKGLTGGERERVVREDILFQEVRFYGRKELIDRLQKPEIVGKVITIEGRLDTKEKRFLVMAVKEPTGSGLENR